MEIGIVSGKGAGVTGAAGENVGKGAAAGFTWVGIGVGGEVGGAVGNRETDNAVVSTELVSTVAARIVVQPVSTNRNITK